MFYYVSIVCGHGGGGEGGEGGGGAEHTGQVKSGNDKTNPIAIVHHKHVKQTQWRKWNISVSVLWT